MNIYAQRSIGNPYIPLLIAGKQIDWYWSWSHLAKQFHIQSLSFSGSLFLPLHQIGPIACMIALHCKFPLTVSIAYPV